MTLTILGVGMNAQQILERIRTLIVYALKFFVDNCG